MQSLNRCCEEHLHFGFGWIREEPLAQLLTHMGGDVVVLSEARYFFGCVLRATGIPQNARRLWVLRPSIWSHQWHAQGHRFNLHPSLLLRCIQHNVAILKQALN